MAYLGFDDGEGADGSPSWGGLRGREYPSEDSVYINKDLLEKST